jgi:hypothetical protein
MSVKHGGMTLTDSKLHFSRYPKAHWPVRKFPVFVVVMRSSWVWSTVKWHWQTQNCSFRRRPCPSYTLPTTNPNGLDPRFRGKGSVTDCLSDEIDWWKTKINLYYLQGFSSKTSQRIQIFYLKIYWCVLCKEASAVHCANHKNRFAITNSEIVCAQQCFGCWTWRYTCM